MRFRPCIDIHNGKIKQIIGGSLCDKGDLAQENFVGDKDGAWYASFYQKDKLKGGHIILLNPPTSPFYEETKRQALLALNQYPNGFQIGGGITDENAIQYLNAGASHVIVTSFVFKNGTIHWENLKKLVDTVGTEHLVLDLSCRKKENSYYIVTDRWQNFTDVVITEDLLDELSLYCSEFLVHGVDVEGKSSGIEKELVTILSKWNKIPITYAGGIGTMEHLKELKELTNGTIDVTIGSALDLFGGPLSYTEALQFISL